MLPKFILFGSRILEDWNFVGGLDWEVLTSKTDDVAQIHAFWIPDAWRLEFCEDYIEKY
jgi:hypothetical protein